MPEIRDLMRAAAGDPPDLPDVETILRRARPRVLRRRVAAGVAALVVGVGGWGATSTWWPDEGAPQVAAGGPTAAPGGVEVQDLRERQLEPGTYATKLGRYDLRLTTYDDAWVAAVVEPGWVALSFRQYVLHLQVWDEVVSPAGAVERPPADLAAWLSANPRLATGSPIPATVGGLAATQVDARVVRPLPVTPPECTARCAILARVAGDGEPVDVEVGQHARFLVIGPAGRQVVLFYRAPEEEFAVVSGAVEALLAGLRLEPSS